MKILRSRDQVKLLEADIIPLVEMHIKQVFNREPKEVSLHFVRDESIGGQKIGAVTVDLKFPDEEGGEETASSDVAVVLTASERKNLAYIAGYLNDHATLSENWVDTINNLLERSKVA